MKIVVNTRMLRKDKLDGIGWFTYQTIKRIVLQNPQIHFTFLFDREFDQEFIFADNVTPIVIGPKARHAFLFHIWYNVSVKRLLNQMKPDLFISTDGILSLGANCKQLTVIHDINFIHYPKDLPFWTRKFYCGNFPKYAEIASRVATVSEYSKSDICKSFSISESKVDVVYNGINENFFSLTEEQKQATRDKFSQGRNYFLFVGSMPPRKNIIRLLQAFDLFKQESQSDFKLIIAGQHFWSKDEISRVIDSLKFKNDVVFTGRLSDENLNNVLASSYALTFVPYFEGFGIPLIEAMQAETAIITSNVTSLPEVAGNAALYVDPYSIQEIKGAMVELFNSNDLRQALIENGKVQKHKFSWDKSASLLMNSIQKAIKGN